MVFRLNLKWGGISVQSPLSTSTSSWPSSYSCRGRDSSFCLARSSAASVLYGESETLNDTSRGHVCSSSPQLLENYYLGTRESKVTLMKGSDDGIYTSPDNDDQLFNTDDKLAYLTITSQATRASQFKLLLKNVDILEDMYSDSNAVRLENEILEQLQRLGALTLFHSCLSRTLKSSSYSFDSSNALPEIVEQRINDPVVDKPHVSKVFIRSGKKEIRKSRRKGKLENDSYTFEGTVSRDRQRRKFASPRRNSRFRSKRQKISRSEAEMSSAVKLVAELEKLRSKLEEETGQTARLSSWADAAGLEKKELLHRLYYGWQCRDELLRSTHSLVMFIGKKYCGLGVSLDDLVQAGKMGILQSAERFDQTRGYKFSTYAQYWIRKSMATYVANYARSGVRIPNTLTKVINQVRKARKALITSTRKYPDNHEISEFTGIPVSKIVSASKCVRIVALVGSIDRYTAEGTNIKIREITPDTSIPSPEEILNRQQMINDVYSLLNTLDPRERQVIILRFGLGSNQKKSLGEIGKMLHVSKEWIRRLEGTALTKLRNEDFLKNLRHYVYMQ